MNEYQDTYYDEPYFYHERLFDLLIECAIKDY